MNIRILRSAGAPGWIEPIIKSIEEHLRRLDAPQIFNVADVPDPTLNTGRDIFVPDEAGGAVKAFSDGADWRRCTDRAVIS